MRAEARGGDGRRALACVIVIVASLAAVGCLPRERINAGCRWTSDTAVLPPDAISARRAHLLEDVARAELTAIGGDRELGIDLLAVFLPMTVLFVAGSRVVATRVAGEYHPDDRGIAAIVLAAIAPLAAALAVALTQMWGTVVEQLRLRNGHVSYRTFELPASRHGWLLWGIALAVFAAIGARELLRPREHPLRQRHGFQRRFG